MQIHHTIVKKAATQGIVLTSDLEGDGETVESGTVTAHHVQVNVQVTRDVEGTTINDAAKEAWANVGEIVAYQAEHPTIRIVQEDYDFVAYDEGDDVARDPELAELFVSIGEHLEAKASDEPEGDEEDGEHGSVVPSKYKMLYAERGDPNNCGDWLAEVLKGLVRVNNEHGREVTDIDRLETIANSNGVAPDRCDVLGTATRGWQGRYRMSCRNMMAPLVAAKGFLFVPDGAGVDGDREIKAPDAWIAEHTPKGKTPKMVVQKDPGAGKASAKTRAKKEPKANGVDKGELGLQVAREALKASRERQQQRMLNA